jgi:putative FmdB family regulatory protein
MPIYEYGCRDCGQQIEVMHGVHDTGPAVCTNCGGPLRKLLSPPAIVFKGTGWAKKERASSSGGRSASPREGKRGGQREGEGAEATGAGDAVKKAPTKPATDRTPATD